MKNGQANGVRSRSRLPHLASHTTAYEVAAEHRCAGPLLASARFVLPINPVSTSIAPPRGHALRVLARWTGTCREHATRSGWAATVASARPAATVEGRRFAGRESATRQCTAAVAVPVPAHSAEALLTVGGYPRSQLPSPSCPARWQVAGGEERREVTCGQAVIPSVADASQDICVAVTVCAPPDALVAGRRIAAGETLHGGATPLAHPPRWQAARSRHRPGTYRSSDDPPRESRSTRAPCPAKRGLMNGDEGRHTTTGRCPSTSVPGSDVGHLPEPQVTDVSPLALDRHITLQYVQPKKYCFSSKYSFYD